MSKLLAYLILIILTYFTPIISYSNVLAVSNIDSIETLEDRIRILEDENSRLKEKIDDQNNELNNEFIGFINEIDQIIAYNSDKLKSYGIRINSNEIDKMPIEDKVNLIKNYKLLPSKSDRHTAGFDGLNQGVKNNVYENTNTVKTTTAKSNESYNKNISSQKNADKQIQNTDNTDNTVPMVIIFLSLTMAIVYLIINKNKK
ncbi:hypothetical protein [uncultured Veillonella sp.]|uniref:hypothetical protein n=1 Tax=uncultured Veillonella sp. TaxID=159268 RepID=UPI0025D38E40|nr:hypothetical protein [uncultured Veillonella sp.]